MFSAIRPPITITRRRLITWRLPRSSMLDAPPPPDVITPKPYFGDYTIKATVHAKDETYIGYAQDLSIAEKTLNACERFGKGCSVPEITFKGGKCDEVIFVRSADGTLRVIR